MKPSLKNKKQTKTGSECVWVGEHAELQEEWKAQKGHESPTLPPIYLAMCVSLSDC